MMAAIRRGRLGGGAAGASLEAAGPSDEAGAPPWGKSVVGGGAGAACSDGWAGSGVI
jgi:hypothetical protein